MKDNQTKEIYIDPNDIRVDTYIDSGPGGQHRNKTDSAVRITHFPTGIVVTATENRSQYKNKAVAFSRLADSLESYFQQEQSKVLQIEKSSTFNKPRSWTWCSWRDEVVNADGVKFSMKRALKGNLKKLL